MSVYGFKSAKERMSEDEIAIRHQLITESVKEGISQALSRHRKLGESIAVWQDGKVVILTGDEIPDVESTAKDMLPEEHKPDSNDTNQNP
jgi:hypothetical protein